jgi:hypothetical protein
VMANPYNRRVQAKSNKEARPLELIQSSHIITGFRKRHPKR